MYHKLQKRTHWFYVVFIFSLIIGFLLVPEVDKNAFAHSSLQERIGDLEGPWEPLSGVKWDQRSGHSSVVLADDFILMMGGNNGSERLDDVWRSADGGETWSLVTEHAAWSPRYDHASVLMNDGSILLMGGNDGVRKNDVWRSTDQGKTWTLVTASASWSARDEFAAVVIPSNGHIILMGGDDDELSYHYYQDDVWRSTNGGETWSLVVADAVWEGRRSHAAVVLSDDTIVLMAGKIRGHVTIGGEIVSSYDLTSNSVYLSTDEGATWTSATGLPRPVGGHKAVVMDNDTIVVMGGHYYSPFGGGESYYRDDVWTTNNKGSTWETDASSPWDARAGHGAAALGDGKIVLFGGYSGTWRNDVWRSSDDGNLWEDISGAEWTQRNGISSVVLPNGGIVLTGGNAEEEYLYRSDDVWYSSDQGHTWTAKTMEAPWDGRFYHTSVVLPDGSIVLMGGYFRKSDVWRSTDQGATWTQMTESAEWSGREDHMSLVLPDGSIILLAGDADVLKNDVWRSTDKGATWQEVASNSNWSPRSRATCVILKDGTLILMGGSEGSNDDDRLNDVWKSTDGGATWTLLTAQADWPAREGHSSLVLSDDTIVVMGGLDRDDNYLNDVWRSTDGGINWIKITEHAEWSGRCGFSSVMLKDGSLLLMGGADGARLNDVWRLGRGELMNYLPLITK